MNQTILADTRDAAANHRDTTPIPINARVFSEMGLDFDADHLPGCPGYDEERGCDCPFPEDM